MNKNLISNIMIPHNFSRFPCIFAKGIIYKQTLSDEGGQKGPSAVSPQFYPLLEPIRSPVDNEDKGVAKCDTLGEKQQTEQRDEQ